MNTTGKVTLHILLTAVLVLSTLGSIVMPGTAALADGLTVSRDFDLPEPPSPPQVEPGETFTVAIQFTAPADEFNSIVLHEIAPAGWQVSGDVSDCTPTALTMKPLGDNGLEYSWNGPYNSGQSFTATYTLTVPGGTPNGIYSFAGSWLVYYVLEDQYVADITGEYQVEVISDTTHPTVTDVIPPNGATGVPINPLLRVTFSEPMNTASAEGAFSIGFVSGTLGYNWNTDNTVMTVILGENLLADSIYTATIGTGAQDVAGNPLLAPYEWSFTTVAEAGPFNRMYYLGLNMANPTLPTHDGRVRRALHMALDRPAIVAASSASIPGDVDIVKSIVNPDLLKPNVNPPYNPVLAVQLLNESGYPAGFTTSIMVKADDEWLAQVIGPYLIDIGVAPILDVVSNEEYHSRLMAGFFDMTIVPPYTDWDNRPELLGRLFLSTSPLNYTGYADPTFDSLFNAADYNAAEDQAFPTAGPGVLPLLWNMAPLSVYTGEASDITSSTATLRGILYSPGEYETVDVSFEWGETAGGPYPNTTTPQALAGASVFSATLSGLLPDTTYNYRAKAEADSETVYGDERSFTTEPEDAIVVTRNASETVLGSETDDIIFAYTINFTAPEDNFNAIGLTDMSPEAWDIAVNTAWCTPAATFANILTTGTAEYNWLSTFSAGTEFTAVFEFIIPAGTPAGFYTFPNGELEYYIAGDGPYYVAVTGDTQVEVVYGSTISGTIAEVNCEVIAGATVELYLGDVLVTSTTSDQDGAYELTAPETGDYTVTATADGFKNKSQAFTVPALGEQYDLNFRGNNGLIPLAPDMSYVLLCANRWLFPPADPECALNMSAVLAAANAWLFP